MSKLDMIISFIFTKSFYHKALAYGIFILLLIFFRNIVLIFFLTFIFAYLFYSSAKFLKINIDYYICKKLKTEKNKIFFKKYFSLNIIIILEYILFLIVFIGIISNAIPKINNELAELSKTIPFLNEQIKNIKDVLGNINQNYSEIDSTVKNIFKNENINYDVISNIFDKIKSAGSIIFKFIFSLLLSFVFLLDRKKLKKYLAGIKKSNFKFLYEEYKIIFNKIIKSFGLILKAQSIIALINSLLTIFGLFIIGSFFIENTIGFPYLLTLGLIVFIFGFIPVIGVFLSSVPIILVGYSATQAFPIVIAIIILIIIIHMIEAYILNPRIVSNFLELPISLTFIILFIGEHFFGIAGLLIGVSLFYFFTELLKDVDKAICKKNKIKKIEHKMLKRAKKMG